MKNPNILATLSLAQRELRQFHSSDKESQALMELDKHIKAAQKIHNNDDVDPWRFVEKHYPDYDHSDEIAYADDLQKILAGELNGNAEKLFIEEFEEDLGAVSIQYNITHREIYEKAIENFLKQNDL